MNRNTVLLAGVIFLAVVAVVGIIVLRGKGSIRSSVKGPGGIGVEIQAEDRDTIHGQGARQKGVKAKEGALAEDRTGSGASQENVETEGKAVVRSLQPKGSSPSKKE
jgi:hypothetical protein